MPLSTWAALTEAHHQRRIAADDGAVPDHRPIAAVLGCSDARVSPTAVFDQPTGALFEVRVAGNTIGSVVLASLDYAVVHLGVKLVIVLGHTNCGAVQAAIDHERSGTDEPPQLEAIVEPLRDVVRQHPDADHLTIAHHSVGRVTTELHEHFQSKANFATVLGAVHDLASGQLRPVEPATH